MNRARMTIVAVLSLVLSLAVALAAYRILEARANPTAREGRIVVATRKMPVGMRLTEADVRLVAWPSSVAIEGGHVNLADVVGRAVIVPVVPNEPLLESKLAPRQAGAGLTAAIPEGMRAVAVKVNEVIGVAGFVLPGTRVDVILTGSPGERGGTDTAKVILENVQVLTAGSKTETDSQGTPQAVTVVTLLVAPHDAQKLALAATDGRIQLALRNPMDIAREDPAAVMRASLYREATPEATPHAIVPVRAVMRREKPAPVAPAPFKVDVFHGTKHETVVFKTGEEPATPPVPGSTQR